MTRWIRTRLVLGVLALLMALPSSASAQTQLTTGKPTVFKVTVTKVEMYNGTSFVTNFPGLLQPDRWSRHVGPAVPGISNLSLPAGTYSQIRVTFSNTFTMKGSLASGGTTYYTTATTLNGGTASQAATVSDSLAEATITNPDWGAVGAPVVQTIDITPVTVTAATAYAPTIKFTVTNSLVLSTFPGTFFFTPASNTVSLV